MITAVVSGSFKFKPEIDQTIEALEETGVKVLEPTRGWLIMPPFEVTRRLQDGQVRPLPTEETLTTKQIEDRFLAALAQADLMYLVNQENYVGSSTGLEIGFALGKDKPIYAQEPLDYTAMGIDDISFRGVLDSAIIILPPEEVCEHYTNAFLG